MVSSSSKNNKRSKSENIEHDSTEASALGQVLRPVVSRWLPNWAKSSFRAGRATGTAETTGVSELPVSIAPVAPRNDLNIDADINLRRTQAQEVAAQIAVQIAELEGKLAKHGEKAKIASAGLARSIDQRQLAHKRLTQANEPVPEASTANPSMLQESFLNFSSVAKLHEKKHSKVLNKIERLNTKHAHLSERALLAQAELSQLDSDNNVGFDTFKQAA